LPSCCQAFFQLNLEVSCFDNSFRSYHLSGVPCEAGAILSSYSAVAIPPQKIILRFKSLKSLERLSTIDWSSKRSLSTATFSH